MKDVEVIICTRNRRQKLLRTIKTVPGMVSGVPVKITVVCDGDAETALYAIGMSQVSKVIFLREHLGQVIGRNMAIQASRDAVLYATDDIEFQPGSIDVAVLAFVRKFPDGDGVVGFNQVNHTKFSKSGVALVGHRFVCRYPEKQLFYPGYYHFACQEIERAAVSLGKFLFCEAATLIHHHPSQEAGEVDDTHYEARKFKTTDRKLSNVRLRSGLTWGANG